MHRMLPSPVEIWRQSHQARDEADSVIGCFGFKEGSMSTIVEDDENSHSKATSQDCEGNSQPERNRQAQVHEIPQGHVRDKSIHYLPDCANRRGLLVLYYDFLPNGGEIGFGHF